MIDVKARAAAIDAEIQVEIETATASLRAELEKVQAQHSAISTRKNDLTQRHADAKRNYDSQGAHLATGLLLDCEADEIPLQRSITELASQIKAIVDNHAGYALQRKLALKNELAADTRKAIEEYEVNTNWLQGQIVRDQLNLEQSKVETGRLSDSLRHLAALPIELARKKAAFLA